MTMSKKIISVLLVIVMLFSTASVAFAADGANTTTSSSTKELNPFLYMTKDEIKEYVNSLDMGALGFLKVVVNVVVGAAFFIGSLEAVDFELSFLKDPLLNFSWKLVKGFDRAATDEAKEAVKTFSSAMLKTKAAQNVAVTKVESCNASVKKTGAQNETISDIGAAIIGIITGIATTGSKTYTFSNGVAKEDSSVKIENFVTPFGTENAIKGAYIADTTTKDYDGYKVITMTFVKEQSVYDGTATSFPRGNSSVLTPIDAANFNNGSKAWYVKNADTSYTGTTVTVEINKEGLIREIGVSAPFTCRITATVENIIIKIEAYDILFEGKLLSSYTFRY